MPTQWQPHTIDDRQTAGDIIGSNVLPMARDLQRTSPMQTTRVTAGALVWSLVITGAFWIVPSLPGCGSTVVDGTSTSGSDDKPDGAGGDEQPDAAPEPAPMACVADLGPTAPTGTCDGSGYCGGISEAKGCIHCAMQGECGQYYSTAALDAAWSDWNVCISECRTSGSPNWPCCDRGCDVEFPEVAAAMSAFSACIFCQWCVQDCGGQPPDGDILCQ